MTQNYKHGHSDENYFVFFFSPLFVFKDRMESFTILTNLIGTRLSEQAYNAVVTLQFTISKNKYIYIYLYLCFCLFL